ncbi:hypothetical protein H1R20_g7205, partial [Candolleomyces eurysporus]
MADRVEFFSNCQGVLAETIKLNVANITSPAGVGPLEKLEARIAAGAIHDSAERCDAPKCHPDTRVAVQDDLYSWVVDGDRESEHPKKIKWVTGPAGTGKTAVVGSLADRCAANGVLGATFFFASWSASIGRRQKTAFVTTIAHQLAQHREDLQTAISAAIEKNPGVFEKNLRVQMETLVLAPLREIALQCNRPQLRGAIIIDGVDECEAEQYYDTTSTGTRDKPLRTNAQDQLKILQVLQAASSDPSFPFCILIASRPERVFREFFDPENNPTLFADKLDLNEDYNADDDITLFLEAQFNFLRRRYHFSSSWPPPGAIQTLVENASGQFIYAATIIRFLDTGHREPPKALLEAVLKMGSKVKSNPLRQLDILYSHILESSPDPPLSVRWISAIRRIHFYRAHISAFNITILLQTDPESNEAEHLLGNLHSLIQIPPPGDQATTKYNFYHKSLLDFLDNPRRSSKFVHSKVLPTPACADWWVSLAIAHKEGESVWEMFKDVHNSQWVGRATNRLLSSFTMANTVEFFSHSQGVQAETINFVTKISSPGLAGVGPLEKLEGRIAAGAIHDSAERCDAPKCHPETRVAVQDDLYDWIVDGDGALEDPKKIKWVTGPAGSGKTAVMGSLAERCAADGILGATFFFASWSSSIGRRRKAAIVTTIAHQLARYHGDLRDEISKAVEANSDIFDKNLRAQMEALVLVPLRRVADRPGGPDLRGVIIIDGLDECEAEQYSDGSRAKSPPPRTNDQDQLEILQVFQTASLDPCFPFRILVASRPERVFREFFDPQSNPTLFSQKIDLHEDHNADADITLFLEAQFSRIRRRYNLPPSWPPPGAVETLVKNASGQFIYAATVIRFLDTGHQEPPKALLDAILEMGSKVNSNPLKQLDDLYSHILASSPDPPLSVRWISAIQWLRVVDMASTASNVNLLLQTDPESNEADHLLGNLHSLIRIPSPSNQATTNYDFYHKSLFDFLKNPGRCGKCVYK